MILTCTGMYLLRNQLMNLLLRNEENDDEQQTDPPMPEPNGENPNNFIALLRSPVIEQAPIAIRDFSSQYGSNGSDSYVVSNICSKIEIYPAYGDSTQASVFRTYGPWWMMMPSYRESVAHFTRWEYHFTSQDFIDIEFEHVVHQCLYLYIYETYNPGTLQTVYVGREDDQGQVTWHRVWTFPERFSIILADDQEITIDYGGQSINDLFPSSLHSLGSRLQSLHIQRDHSLMLQDSFARPSPPAARLPRIVKIPLEKKFSYPTRFVRLEFDHRTVNYYSEIDTVLLAGRITPEESLSSSLTIEEETSEEDNEEEQCESSDRSLTLTDLPFDILSHICTFLDLRSLVRLSSTCRTFHQQCLDSIQFQSLNLQPYWNGITDYALENFFSHYCEQTKYLSLAWTRNLHHAPFHQLLSLCSKNLVQLNLASCQYLTGSFIRTVVQQCPMIEILNLDNCLSLNHFDFLPLKSLNHLRSLSCYRTKIDFRTLLPLIDNNRKHFEHLNLGSCQRLGDTIGILKLLFSHCSNLQSIDLWRAHDLSGYAILSLIGSSHGIGEENRRILKLSSEEQEELALLYSSVNMPIVIDNLRHLKCLREVDLGWTDPPAGFVRSFVQQIGQNLIKLFLTACRGVVNEDLLAVGEHCPQLRQLDILGSSIITENTIEFILERCHQLEFLDLSFCDRICDETVALWKCKYSSCSLKRSYSPLISNDVTMEFP